MEVDLKAIEKEVKEWTEKHHVDEVGPDIITARGPTGERCRSFVFCIVTRFDREKVIDIWKDAIIIYRKFAGSFASEPHESLPQPEENRIFTLYWRRYPTFTFIETDGNSTLALVARLLITCQNPLSDKEKE